MRAPPINISSYKQAENIVRSYNERHEGLLRDIVASVSPIRGYADGLEYGELICQVRRIKGVAQRMLNSRDRVGKVKPARVINTLGAQDPRDRTPRQLPLFS